MAPNPGKRHNSCRFLTAAQNLAGALAGIGLAGALATPLLVQSDAHDAWPAVIYLAIVTRSGLPRRMECHCRHEGVILTAD
jgi:hypothetical protein